MSITQVFFFLVGSLTLASALKCNEGFNATLGGVPFYHWDKNNCTQGSTCFGQQLNYKTYLDLELIAHYGGCVSTSYADLLTCENLFGADSTQDPALLLNLIPDLDQKFKLLADSFTANMVEQLKLLFSNGNGGEEFMAGLITFVENLGFKVTKLRQLQGPLADVFNSIFGGDYTVITENTNKLLTAIGNLDTEEPTITNCIYEFMGNFLNATQINEIKAEPQINPLITRLPGLLKSMIPDSWESSKWFNAVFDILCDIDFRNPKKSVADALATIKTAANIPADVAEYTDPFFNTLPELVQQMVNGNYTYAGRWSLDMLKEFSDTDANTEAMKTALINFIQGIGIPHLDPYIVETIEFFPGLFYKVFPANKTLIGEVYKKIADGFASFDFGNIGSTAAETKMSSFIIGLVNQISPGAIANPSFNRTIVINFSKMFYDLLDDYKDKLDIFFDTLQAGFKDFPSYNAGTIISSLITNLGGTVPKEVEPLLSKMQDVLNAGVAYPFNATVLFAKMTEVVTAYKTNFPASSMPGAVQGLIDFIRDSMNGKIPPQDMGLQMQYVTIDLQLALFKAWNFTADELSTALIKAFPAYGTMIKLMKALDPDDVKNLYRNFMTWVSVTCRTSCTAESLTAAMKSTIEAITAKLGDVLPDLRHLAAPNACQFYKCAEDLCNTHAETDQAPVVTKKPDPSKSTTTTPVSTTSGASKLAYAPVAFNSAILLMLTKTLFG